MKATPRLARLVAALAIPVTVLTSCAIGKPTVPDQRLVGQWHGLDRFNGISYQEIVQHKVEIQMVDTTLNISTNATVTGQVGGAELTDCTVRANRGWLGRFLHLKTDFIIVGKISGSVVPGSEGGTRPINVPFNLQGAQIDGTMFVVYTFKYPFPFLGLRVSH
jgi:hypothetical protein